MYTRTLHPRPSTGRRSMRKNVLASAAAVFTALLILFSTAGYGLAQEQGPQDAGHKTYLPLVNKTDLPGYYVSPSGSDSNPGTSAQPWKTINKAASKLVAGDILYVHGGTYNEAVVVPNSGTAQKPITILAFAGETPIIDGKGSLPAGGDNPLVYLKGDWIRFSGFEVRYSSYMGVQLGGQHDTVDHVFSHHHRNNGIWVQGDYGTVTDSQLWQNSQRNANTPDDGSSALTTARDSKDGKTDFAVLRNNTVWENWGIGIDSYESNGTLIENNVVHDNAIGNIYISDATNIICKGNLVYMKPGSVTYGINSSFGILLGDEKYTPQSNNIQVINNIVYGNKKNFTWSHLRDPDGMHNVLVANNIFANNMPNNENAYNVDISEKSINQNLRFINNIIIQDDGQRIEDIQTSTISLSHNLWSKAPRSSVLGSGDLVKDPKLARTGTPYSYEWYRLTSGSPAINSGMALSEVTDDYLRVPREATPDIGPLEYGP